MENERPMSESLSAFLFFPTRLCTEVGIVYDAAEFDKDRSVMEQAPTHCSKDGCGIPAVLKSQ